MRRTSILLADDHPMICAGLQKMLEPEFEVVACVGDGRALVKEVTDLKPDLVLLDVGMPLLNGLDAARELKKMMPRVKLVFLTVNADPNVAFEALKAGASGYLLKESEGEEILQGIRNVLRGLSYVSPQIKAAIDENFTRDPKAMGRPRHLSDRQREVLQLLAEGGPMRDVADALHISYNTVRFHKRRIMDELGIKNNSELVQYAIRHALILPHQGD
jgi:DNA-binding NarL/FixJ family response regulator